MTVEIAVLGGYGAVGRVAALTLARRIDGVRLRIGGRRPEEAERLLGEHPELDGVAVAVDVDDADALVRFCAGSDVVVNCAGPSYRILDRVARPALDAGCGYVDAGGDLPVYERLEERGTGGGVAVLTAGMMPGLTGLLPRWLARQGFDRADALTAYVGTMDRLTPAGAADYLLSLGGEYGESQAAWRDGRRVPRATNPLSGVDLPFFPGGVDAFPYLSYETEATARALGLRRVDWYNVFDGGTHMTNALSRLQGAITGQSALEPAAEELTRAAALDLFGREPYQVMVFELSGECRGEAVTRTLVLRAGDTYQLTGTVAALAAVAVHDGTVGPGVHFAAEVLPSEVVAEVERLPAVSMLEVFDMPAAAASAPAEGAL